MKVDIRPHHQQGIDNLVSAYVNDERFLGLIIGGSVAKGCARDDSDVDFMIIASDEEYSKRKLSNDLFINRRDLTTYPGGFVDGKIIDLAYLEQVMAYGNEPSRAAFDGAFAAFSSIEGLDQMIEEIAAYPEDLRADKLRTFYSMSFIQHWLMNEAERHQNLYTMSRAASQLALFAGRLILAYNRILFPYHKWFYEYLNRCPQKPPGMIEQMDQLLKSPSAKHADRLFQSIKEFHNWGVEDLDAYLWFMKEVEWSWRADKVSLEDW